MGLMVRAYNIGRLPSISVHVASSICECTCAGSFRSVQGQGLLGSLGPKPLGCSGEARKLWGHSFPSLRRNTCATTRLTWDLISSSRSCFACSALGLGQCAEALRCDDDGLSRGDCERGCTLPPADEEAEVAADCHERSHQTVLI